MNTSIPAQGEQRRRVQPELREWMVALLRYRLMGKTYREIDGLIFGDPDAPGWPAWTLAQQLAHAIEIGGLLPRPGDREPS